MSFEFRFSQPDQQIQYSMIVTIIQARGRAVGKYFELLRASRHKSAGHGEHQIEAAASAVHVQHLAGRIQAGTQPALQGCDSLTYKRHST